MSEFEKKLKYISSAELKVLQCLSIFWEKITAQEFISLVKHLGLKAPNGKTYTVKSVSLFRKSLIKKKVIRNINDYSGNGFQIFDEELKEFLTREAVRESWFSDVVEIIQTNFNLNEFSVWSYRRENYYSRLLRDYRLSIYQQNTDQTAQLFEEIVENDLTYNSFEIILQIFSNPFQNKFLSQFDPDFQAQILAGLFAQAIETSKPTAELWDFVRENKIEDELVKSYEIDELIYKGEIKKVKNLIGNPDTFQKTILSGLITLFERDYKKSINYFEAAIKLWKKAYRKRKGYPDDRQMFFYALALLKTDEAKFFDFAEDFYSFSQKNYPDSSVFKAIKAIEYFLKNNDKFAEFEAGKIEASGFSDKIIGIILAAIIPSLKVPDYAEELLTINRDLGYRWIVLELNNLLAIKKKPHSKRQKQARETATTLEKELGFAPLGNLIPPVEDWERALKVLTLVANDLGGTKESESKINETRVAWQIDFDHGKIQPVEQKYGKTGWTKGRNIALKRMFERDVKNLTEQDSLVVKNSMSSGYYGYYGGYSYDFDWEEAMPALIGHPFLFLSKNPNINIQLLKGEPSLVVKEINDNIEISFDTEISEAGCVVQKETETRYKVVEITDQHIIIAESLQNNRLQIPSKGREALMKAIQPLMTKIAIESDLEEHFEELPAVAAENRIHALITPVGEGFHLEFFVKPFGTVPPYIKPGRGNESVVAELEGVRTRTKRDLKNERQLLDEIEEASPLLAESESPNYEWNLSDAETCLAALTDLETPRKDGKLVIEWPKGQKLKLLGNINFENFSLNIKGKSTWFEVEGKVRVNEELVLSMQELTKLIEQDTKDFVELSDGQFIAITDKLRKHLQSLNAVMDNKNRLHKLRAGILEEFSGQIENLKTNKAWKDHLKNLEKARKFVPKLPTTFEADLRPYQTEGYLWLSRLANWGVGACLADDMGLGKTLQALAILVERAEKGGALVVAPVSVCRNWMMEARRFAPTLNFHIFGDGDRQEMVEKLGKYDVLVTSYNLLQLEEKIFTDKKFATIVLDEAQAIKNRSTKRSKTVMKLEGDFRLITTGTPIENHLGELWNLFNFLNPGLLGSYDFFNKKFALPIEKHNDAETRRTLQKLIKPFILRRRKNQVLEDLPEKTEIMLTVEMSLEERSFYEAIRREALEKIESEDGAAKNKRFRILAELTRLRLACCHPQLVNENIPISSSKLKLFGNVLEELLENKHKALVFSQFVKHLAIVEKYLKNKGINYQYLDGSTPAHIRQKRIDSFQRGTGEVFLISLKAGGTGLNLTAADYVIHLDPWWNPAVEDQATDRVHRIGQNRPVTVYRLVTENTVEEKILKLHETKRDLADSLLAGTDSSSKLTADDLLALISDV